MLLEPVNARRGVLRTTLALAPDDAGLHYALGLVLVRLKRQDEALEGISPGSRTRARPD
jgi:hypothetical protein